MFLHRGICMAARVFRKRAYSNSTSHFLPLHRRSPYTGPGLNTTIVDTRPLRSLYGPRCSRTENQNKPPETSTPRTLARKMASYALLLDQSILTIPNFTLECGSVIKEVPIAYKTWGNLNETRDNVMVICHAFTGSADVEDW